MISVSSNSSQVTKYEVRKLGSAATRGRGVRSGGGGIAFIQVSKHAVRELFAFAYRGH